MKERQETLENLLLKAMFKLKDDQEEIFSLKQ